MITKRTAARRPKAPYLVDRELIDRARGRNCNPLTFAELVAPSGFLAARFLSFDGTWVAAEEAGGFQRGAPFSVHLQQGAGDTELGGFGLAFDTTAGSVDLYIIFVQTFYRFQGQLDLVLQVYQGKILFIVFVVDRYFAFTAAKKDAGYSLFTATNCIFLLFHLSEKLEG